MKKQLRTTGGFTLLELLIVLAVMAVLVSWGLPSLQESIRGNRIISQNNEMLAILRYARSEAIRRNQDVEVHLSADGTEWQAYIEDPDHDADVEGCQLGQLRCADNDNVTMATSNTTIIFNNRGYIRDADDAWTSETLYLQHENCSGNLRRRIDIMPTGQINSCRLPCGSVDSCGT
ncbi:MAG: GspH/FimT family pseudopilin [Xanthomonadales bacterium]|jgi:prepilin-type N-terminal cleavage/methylation domain-containing protein|nr:GspH/FimT family pseudopilin [Xanthomonadales bacterium]